MLYYQSALALKLPCQIETYIDGFSFYFSGKRYYLCITFTPFNNGSSDNIARNKYCVNKLLHEANIPVPKAFVILKSQFYDNQMDLGFIEYPVVAKPTIDGSFGDDVFCNIKDEKTLRDYLNKLFKRHQRVSIEKFEANLRSYRVLVSQNKILDIIETVPAHVMGDGVHTLTELIEITNKEREKRIANAEVSPSVIKIEEEHHAKLSEIGVSLSDIPRKDQRIDLCYKPNSTCGGTMKSAAGLVCPENIALILKAAKTLSLDFVGFDLICEDISKPIGPTRGFFIEANYAPGIQLHEKPTDGVKNCVTRKALVGFLKKRHPLAYFWHRIRTMKGAHFYFKCIVLLGAIFFFYIKIV